ncbi:GrpB family protein [Aldersonia sp. NBC_00410]|uniref:GrpB family protein n=1 Tax=Aldersonia sp. NBC_00410 TaxID=2975954 RepID=UPI0022552C0B|nr:GrpB family protein [Aldersonia sp. NBC_00410]MCX5045512.1 GrpB family protein [Aldersonia sp. NBC_00410]
MSDTSQNCTTIVDLTLARTDPLVAAILATTSRSREDGYVDERTELVGGIDKRDIHIVDYDPTWPERFNRERIRIAEALGDTACRIDHIGSTSVPDLAAKPIVDIE